MNKSINYLLIGLLGLTVLFSCSSDDPEVGGGPDLDVEQNTGVVINEISHIGTDWIEIYNPTNETIDISSFYLCLGPGTYSQISELSILSGSTNLEAGSFVVISDYFLPNDGGGLGLFEDSSFGSADSIIDFVQYGVAGTPRENVAVEAGIWDVGTFVPLASVEGNTLAFEGNGSGADSWSETITPTVGGANVFTTLERGIEVRTTVVFNEISYASDNDWIELYNPTNEDVDISNYFLCLGPGTYRSVSSLLSQDSVVLGSNDLIVVSGYNLPDALAALSLYRNNNDFESSENIIDFVQYGQQEGLPRLDLAEDRNLWYLSDFVPVVSSSNNTIIYEGNGTGASSWSETSSPSPGEPNI